jgi:predicted NBD/HSP70 family sugar kinase
MFAPLAGEPKVRAANTRTSTMASDPTSPTSPTATLPGAPTARPADLSRGTNQAGTRLYNERLLLSLARRHTSLPKAELARLTGLSAQTVSVIVNRLEADGLLVRQELQRGKVGQPSVPYALNPDAAYSVGLKIGRRSSDLVLVDFLGRVRKRIHSTHRYPLPAELMRFLREGFAPLTADLDAAAQARICGLGIASPFELWNWESEVGAPGKAMQAWRGFDTTAEIAAISPWPVLLCNDGTAACAAECFFGSHEALRDFLYVFIGSFIGGGVVLGGNVVQGRSGNAGAIGSLPIARVEANGVTAQQLIRNASLYVLENRVRAAGKDPSGLWAWPAEWPEIGVELDQWVDDTAGGLAILAASAMSIIDFEAIVIDGSFPAAIRTRLRNAAETKLQALDLQGLTPAQVLEGSIGADARAIGGATLPMIANFARDHEILFRASA